MFIKRGQQSPHSEFLSAGVRGSSNRRQRLKATSWHSDICKTVLGKLVSSGVAVIALPLVALGFLSLCYVFSFVHVSNVNENSFHADHVREFTEWARERGLKVSQKVNITQTPPHPDGPDAGADADIWGPYVLSSKNPSPNSNPNPDSNLTLGRLQGEMGRGLMAVEDIKAGEWICTIPHIKLGFSAPTPSQKTPRSETTQPGWASLALHLLNERSKGATSAWSPYIKILPTSSPLPVSLPPHLWKELQWPVAEGQLAGMRKEMEDAYAELARPQFGLEEFVWAVSVVHSRSFTLGGREFVLMPFMDMINHHHDNNAEWSLDSIRGEEVEIVARRDIKAGGEVLVSFGPRSNDNLVMFYGFVLENNPFDVVPLFKDFESAIQWQMESYCVCKHPSWVPNRDVSESDSYQALRIARNDCVRSDSGSDPTDAFARASSSMKRFREWSGGGGRMAPKINASHWWDLVNEWGDLGYEYMPYRPGPDVRARGLVDPNLVVAFSAKWEEGGGEGASKMGGESKEGEGEEVGEGAGNRLGEWGRAGLARMCHRFVDRLRSAYGFKIAEDVCGKDVGSYVPTTLTSLVAIGEVVFKILERKSSRQRWRELSKELRAYIEEILCHAIRERGNIVKAYREEQGILAIFFAQLQIAIRAIELLVAHQTSIGSDRRILIATSQCRKDVRLHPITSDAQKCVGVRSEALVQHRVMRKRMLIACVHNILSMQMPV